MIGEFADEARMAPMTVSDDTWSDIRMRAAAHDKAVIGDPGGFWMFYFPKRAFPNVSLCLRNFASTRFARCARPQRGPRIADLRMAAAAAHACKA